MLRVGLLTAAAIGLALTATGCGSSGAGAACGNGMIDTDEDCDPPDGVFCDSECQSIDPCAAAGVCDDGNECTENNCTADPSDNTAFCENPNMADGTACDGGNATCDAGRCVSAPPCGDGTVDPGEDCDPPDGVFCDDECQAIDPCAVPDVCDDENDCTVDSCTADPSDNTAVCENANVPDLTACAGGNGTCDAGQCTFCGDGTVDPGEDCDPPDGVVCDDECQEIDPCAAPGVCDDGNVCTANNCTADPSDNTAICENPNLPDGTACNGPSGTCDAGQCVAPDAPVLSNIGQTLVALNDCGLPGSALEYKVDFTDPNGDVPPEAYAEELPGGARVFVGLEFSNGPTDSYESLSFFNEVTGNGFAGTVGSINCLEFGIATWVDVTLTINDASGDVSNSTDGTSTKATGR